MSNAGPGLSPNEQAATSKVAATPHRTMFQSSQPKAPLRAPGTGGSKGTGGVDREPKCLVSK
jgi:hypothetical protein